MIEQWRASPNETQSMATTKSLRMQKRRSPKCGIRPQDHDAGHCRHQYPGQRSDQAVRWRWGGDATSAPPGIHAAHLPIAGMPMSLSAATKTCLHSPSSRVPNHPSISILGHAGGCSLKQVAIRDSWAPPYVPERLHCGTRHSHQASCLRHHKRRK